MTFYEAAIEVLRGEGRPLHYKKITANAIKQNLLSHVGRTPDATMEARLTQELQRPEDDRLILQVRPGVYAIKDGVDSEDARQTIQLNKKELPDRTSDLPTQEAVHTDDEIEAPVRNSDGALLPAGAVPRAESDSNSDADQPSGRQRSRSRSRDDKNDNRGARSNSGRSGGQRRSDDNSTDDDNRSSRSNGGRSGGRGRGGDNDKADNSGQRNRNGQRNRRDQSDDQGQERSRRSAPGKPQPPRNDRDETVPENLTAHVEAILTERGSLRTRDIEKALRDSPYSDIVSLSSDTIRNALRRANARRGSEGKPPVFAEAGGDSWTLAAATDSGLAASYERLDEWQEEHERLLRDRLVGLVTGMNEAQLRVTLALVMERAGYTHIEDHDPVGDESINFTAASTRGFSSERVVVRLLKPRASADSQAVAALRGGLHSYRAERGILVALGGFDEAAVKQADVANVAPVDLVDAHEMARLMFETEVGVRKYHVVTACLDDTFFSG